MADATATAPATESVPRSERHDAIRPEEVPRVHPSRRAIAAGALFVVAALAFLYFLLPRFVGLGETWSRLRQGDVWWLGLAAGLEVLSYVGYVVLFRGVFAGGEARIGWRVSYEITMAGVAASRLFASAGAGGIALTVWALRRSGMDPRVAARRMVAFITLLYGVYMSAVVIDGVGLSSGIIPGPAPFAITVLPAIFGVVLIVIFLVVSLAPTEPDRLLARLTRDGGCSRVLTWLAALPATAAGGVRIALALLRERRPSLLGAVAWWGFDIATLWACFHAFGAAPPRGVIVMAYFVGLLGSILPLPGGIGGVDGGMIAAFTAFGVDVDVSIVAVLAYRAFAFWLPTVPGAIAYLQLRQTVRRWQAVPVRV